MGDIAIIRTSTSIQNYLQEIAYTIMDAHKKVKEVLAQTGGVSSNFRLRQLNFIAGENRTVTFSHRMWVLVSVDVRRCFFSPRLSHGRMRVARQVSDGETVVNMFAGVGCFSILIAKHSEARKVYSIDSNLGQSNTCVKTSN